MNCFFKGTYITSKTLVTNDHSILFEETDIECNKRYITFVGSGHYTTRNNVTKYFEYTGFAEYPRYNEDGTGELKLHDKVVSFWTDTFNSNGTERGKRHKTIIIINAVDANGRITATSKESDCWLDVNNKTEHAVPNSKHGCGSWG